MINANNVQNAMEKRVKTIMMDILHGLHAIIAMGAMDDLVAVEQ
jgi:hypothetical protein